jgi:tripartite-type tricarboxylate transporter receptor subunit TctC
MKLEDIGMKKSVPLLGRAIAVGLTLLGVALAGPAAAAEYPDRAIKLIVPFAPGGASDQAARMLSVPLSEALKQSVVVENRPGAGGNVGIGIAAHAKPDGYTLLVASSAFVVNPSLAKAASYDPLKSFAFVTEIGSSPNVLVARPESGIKTFEDLVRVAKEQPGKIFYSSAGVGTTPHLTGELIKLRAGIDMVHVPFAGAGPAVQAVLAGGQVQIASSALSVVQPHIAGGTLIPIVQTGMTRATELPDTPTLVEVGYPNAVSETFQAVFAPAGTPQPIVDRLVHEVQTILQQPAMQEALGKLGFVVSGKGPKALEERVISEIPMWKAVIDRAGIQPQ